jgi:uncharacterized protein (TIGR03437 family)
MMERTRKLMVAKVAVVLSAIPLLIWAHASGPDVGATNAGGEGTCNRAQCHVGTNVNAGGGKVEVTFPFGLTYTPGTKQHLIVTVSDPSARAWGFQLTARQASAVTTMAGTFTSTDRNTAVLCMATPSSTNVSFLDFPGPQTCTTTRPFTYIEHTVAGSTGVGRIQAGSQTFEFDWIPPAANVGNIQIFVSGNGANNNGNESGDHIYNTSYTLTPAAASGPPSISAGGVVSAGAFGGFSSVAPGSWVEIYGANLSPTSRGWAGSDFNGVNAPTSLDGVKVTIGGQAAFVDYVSPGQVNAQVPSNVATGSQQITVTNGGQTSSAYSLTVNALQPGLLAPSSFLIGGKQYVVAQFTDGTYVLPPNSIAGVTTRAARAGETIIVYGVGFGPVLTSSNTNIPAGQVVQQANQLTNPMQMKFGSALANLSYFGLAPNFVGLYQFNVVVPPVPANNAVPLSFTLNGADGAQTLYTAVQN